MNTQQLLWLALDGQLTEHEQAQLSQALVDDPGLQAQWQDLQALNVVLSQQDFRFKPFFAGRLMQHLRDSVQQGFSQALQHAFLRISLPALGIGLVLLLFIYISQESLSVDTLTGASAYALDEVMTQWYELP